MYSPEYVGDTFEHIPHWRRKDKELLQELDIKTNEIISEDIFSLSIFDATSWALQKIKKVEVDDSILDVHVLTMTFKSFIDNGRHMINEVFRP